MLVTQVQQPLVKQPDWRKPIGSDTQDILLSQPYSVCDISSSPIHKAPKKGQGHGYVLLNADGSWFSTESFESAYTERPARLTYPSQMARHGFPLSRGSQLWQGTPPHTDKCPDPHTHRITILGPRHRHMWTMNPPADTHRQGDSGRQVPSPSPILLGSAITAVRRSIYQESPAHHCSPTLILVQGESVDPSGAQTPFFKSPSKGPRPPHA